MDMKLVLWVLAAYLIGAIPFGFLIGKMRGIDVRTVGSHNIGATNVFRTVGRKWGLIAFTCDVLKGLIPVIAAKCCLSTLQPSSLNLHLPLAVGVATVVGHMLTPYMKFRGGKGVATAFGMLLGLIPGVVGTAFGLFSLVFACTNYISLSSCSAAAFLLVAVWFPILGGDGSSNLPQCILVSLIAAFIIFKHRSNISRLAKGTESKIYLFRKKAA